MAARTLDMLVRHLRDNARAWANFLRAPPENLPSKLMTVGAVTCGVAACAAVSPPADGVQLVTHHSVRLGAAALAFIGGLCVISAAFWVAAAAPRRGAVGHIILCASLVPLFIAIGLSGSDNSEFVFHVVFDAIQP